MTTVIPPEAFSKGVLSPVKHHGLIARLDYFADRAGIAPHYIWTPVLDKLKPNELEYLKACLKLVRKGCVGAYYVDGHHDIIGHMAAMTGALVRAFRDARMMTALDIVDATENDGDLTATVLFIPNFYMAREFGRYDSRKIAALMELLYSRAQRGNPTVIHIEDAAKAEAVFGHRLTELLDERYILLSGDA